MYRRIIVPSIGEALLDTPVVLLAGVRQSGKTTLVRSDLFDKSPTNYATFDDLDVLAAATADPVGFLKGMASASEPVILDEIQRAPGLFPAIKASVDRDRRPGRFLLTGSANVLMLPKVSESLAGRMEVITLWPLAQAEIEGADVTFVDKLFDTNATFHSFSSLKVESRTDLVERVIRGGYPEAIQRASVRRTRWFDSYLSTILQRDVRDIANIDGLTSMPRLLSILAARNASLLNASDISRTAGIPLTTLTRYLTVLETTYLTVTVPAWSGNFTTRQLKSPKTIISDSGLAAHLIGASSERILANPQLLGPLLEGFVAMEILKDIERSDSRPAMYHWRTSNRDEVDLVLERRDGTVVGIEVKSSATVGAPDFKGLRTLAALCGDRFVRGVVLYTGDRTIPFGENLFAVPVSAMWQAN